MHSGLQFALGVIGTADLDQGIEALGLGVFLGPGKIVVQDSGQHRARVAGIGWGLPFFGQGDGGGYAQSLFGDQAVEGEGEAGCYLEPGFGFVLVSGF